MFARCQPSRDFKGGLHFLYRGTVGETDPTITWKPTIDPGPTKDWRRLTCHGLKSPVKLRVAIKNAKPWFAKIVSPIVDEIIYNRAEANWILDDTPVGSGWVEYMRLPQKGRWLVLRLSQLRTFFWRRFPWFGQ